LIDSKLDLVHSVNAARHLMGLPNISEALVSSYVGDGRAGADAPGLGPAASDADVQRALESFWPIIRDHMLDNTYLYPASGSVGWPAGSGANDGGATISLCV